MHDLPVLGFEGRDSSCTDAQPLLVRWKDGKLIGGILAPLDPRWLKAFHRDQERDEQLRSQGVTVLADHRSTAGCPPTVNNAQIEGGDVE
jgi:hypothetical protein